jgi:hypothetical protein
MRPVEVSRFRVAQVVRLSVLPAVGGMTTRVHHNGLPRDHPVVMRVTPL